MPVRRGGGGLQRLPRRQPDLLAGGCEFSPSGGRAGHDSPAPTGVLRLCVPDRRAVGVVAERRTAAGGAGPDGALRAGSRPRAAEVRRPGGHLVLHLDDRGARVPRLRPVLRADQPPRQRHHAVGLRHRGRDLPGLALRAPALLPLALSAGGGAHSGLARRAGAGETRTGRLPRLRRAPAGATVRITYDPTQTDEAGVRAAIQEPHFDRAGGRWVSSPYRISGSGAPAGEQGADKRAAVVAAFRGGPAAGRASG